jgi:hypothetical protein
MAFPANLTNAIDGVTDVIADHLNHLEAKVGIDGSTVTTSLDYLLKNPSSVSPGHRHVYLYKPDGSARAVIVDANGNVGIGTTSPGAALQITSPSYPVLSVIRTTTATAGLASGMSLKTITSGSAVNGFGGSFIFEMNDAETTGDNALARVTGIRDGADNSGALTIWTNNTGTETEKLRVDRLGNVGIGISPSSNVLLHLYSTTKGFLPPVMTTAQKNTISSPPAGLVVYDSTLNKLCVYNGSAWETITSS